MWIGFDNLIALLRRLVEASDANDSEALLRCVVVLKAFLKDYDKEETP